VPSGFRKTTRLFLIDRYGGVYLSLLTNKVGHVGGLSNAAEATGSPRRFAPRDDGKWSLRAQAIQKPN
jgi:hypothetical protein